MVNLDIPEHYLNAAPIIITSPTTRCGTTVLQRLLTASDNAFIYGEEVGNHFVTLTTWFSIVFETLAKEGADRDLQFQEALSGKLNEWRPHLHVPTQIMLRAWIDTYFQLPLALAEFGRSIDRPIWGFKWPGYPRDTIRALLALMPRARVIYIYRNLIDVLMSAKARRFVKTDEDVAKYCSEWSINMDECHSLKSDERLLFLKYETLLEARDRQVRMIEDFARVSNIQRHVLDVKVNTYQGDEREGRSHSQYIEPAELTDADRAAVHRCAGVVLAQHYPGI